MGILGFGFMHNTGTHRIFYHNRSEQSGACDGKSQDECDRCVGFPGKD